MIENIQIKGVKKNIRYRVVCIESKYYLIDVDRFLLGFICPIFYWLFPHPAMEIEKSVAEEIVVNPIQTKASSKSSVLAGGLAVFFSAILRTFFKDQFNTQLTFVFSIILLALFFILGCYIRWLLAQNAKKKLTSVLNLESLKQTKIRIYPKSIAYIFKLLGGVLLTWLSLSVSIIAFCTDGDWLFLIISFLSFLILLLLNVFSVMLGVYKVDILKNSI